MENITTSIKWIDLGLSVLWTDRNLGAKETFDYGNYYAFGELIPKNIYNLETYLNIKSFKINNLEVPTIDQLNELKTECTWTWTYNYNDTGVAGQIITSKINGNSIFLPAAGGYYRSDLYGAGSDGYYWSSSLNTGDSSYAYSLDFYSDLVGWSNSNRYYGHCVRLIKKNKYVSSKNISS